MGLYFAILIIPGRGQIKKKDARWLAVFLLVTAGLLIIWGVIALPLLKKLIVNWEHLDDETLLAISRIAFIQAVVGMLALGSKGIALLIPHIRKYRVQLSDLSEFKITRKKGPR